MPRDYDALVLDLDGTLVDGNESVHARDREAIRSAAAEGVAVMVATGRSSISAHAILEDLGLDAPAVVFNGAGLYAWRERRLLEERVLGNRTHARALALGAERDWLTVVMCADQKLGLLPRDDVEASALAMMTSLRLVPREELTAEFVLRVTFFSREHERCEEFGCEVEAAIGQPVYVTSFPLSILANHRASPLHVVDVHPPCLGKAEAMRVLAERYGIPAQRVVAVGDATNDLPMFEAAGLAVCMADGMPEALAKAQRVIGGCGTAAIADLVDELFLRGAGTRRVAS